MSKKIIVAKAKPDNLNRLGREGKRGERHAKDAKEKADGRRGSGGVRPKECRAE